MSLRLLAALLLLLLGLPSCIEGDEQLWLERDGSGRIEATYRMPPAIIDRLGGAAHLQKRLEDAIAQEPSIRLEHIGSRIENTLVVFELRADFESADTFVSLPRLHLRDPGDPEKPSAEEAFFGQAKLKLKGLMLDYERRIDLSPLLPASVRDNAGMLGDSAFRYTLHLPNKPSDHNATSTSNEGRTLLWEFPLKDHASSPMRIHASLLLPLPWWLWTALGLLAIIVPLGLVRFLRKRLRKA